MVKLFYVDLEQVIQSNGSLIEIECPTELRQREPILAAVSFPTDRLISATWMNRVQNEVYFSLCDVLAQNCTTVGTRPSLLALS